MPWSAKAQALIREQYAAVGAAAQAALAGVMECLNQAAEHGADVNDLLKRHHERQKLSQDYVQAYQRYCRPVGSLADVKFAPFHLLATEGHVHVERDHVWHMETLGKVCAADSALLLATPYKLVDVTDAESQLAGAQWWEELTGSGGEGMVVKPLDFVAPGRKGLAQLAVKCRGREYLRIIYGPEHTLPENRERLRPVACLPSAPWRFASLLWASRLRSPLSARNRSAAFTNACSGCWRSKANRWIPACDGCSEPGVSRKFFAAVKEAELSGGHSGRFPPGPKQAEETQKGSDAKGD